MARTLEIEVPDDLVSMLGSPEAARAKAREALILSLLREGRISQGRAAEILGTTRWDLIDLMAAHDIRSGPETAAEVDSEMETIRRTPDAGTNGP